jgi:hypothetical protein
VPTEHYLYDACWKVALPMSLIYALLSSSSSSSSPSATAATKTADARGVAMRRTVLGMALPFVAGSIGSVLGCVSSYLCIDLSTPAPDGRRRGGGGRRSDDIGALIAGCLSASYIGGTVNFFATANALLSRSEKDGIVGGIGGIDDVAARSAFGSVAAADLVVMALYFAFLQSMSGSTILRRLFPANVARQGGGGGGRSRTTTGGESTDGGGTRSAPLSVGSTEGGGENFHDEHGIEMISTTKERSHHWKGTTALASAMSTILALISVNIAIRLERWVTTSFPRPFNPPGTMCAFLALLGLALERIIGSVSRYCRSGRNIDYSTNDDNRRRSSSRFVTKMCDALDEIPVIAPALSDMCFYLLFAAVGSAADLPSAVAGGPSALAFASLALLVHIVTTVALSWACTRLGSFRGMPRISTTWEEVLTASNAAIGGPSTAAAFAAGLIPADNDGSDEGVERSNRRSALVIAATFWGVFGYAIATGECVYISKGFKSCRVRQSIAVDVRCNV